ncbi:GNAT family N-acetyltransferase [Micromonospora sp. CA-263727]
MGYWTAPWARGQGVAVRAVRAVARWSFEELKLRRLL